MMPEFNAIPVDFFERPTLVVAEELLGHLLVHQVNAEFLVGKIVETEAYLGTNDLAAHAVAGVTQRTKVLFGNAGFAYVFRMRAYHCVNVVTEEVNNPSCVLIRAIEPLLGTDSMILNRNTLVKKQTMIANGPGKLCQALKIDMSHYGANLTDVTSPLFLAYGKTTDHEIEKSPRIGISKDADKLYRFTIKNNQFVSK